MKNFCLFVIGMFATTVVFGAEGDVGTQAYPWSGYSDLASTPKTYNLADYQGKVVLMIVFQYNCGGCNANAPIVGKIADSLGSGMAGVPFQAIGTEIDNGTYAQIQNPYRANLTRNAPNLNCPLVHVPYDTGINKTDPIGTKWKRYNSYRDNYFVISHTGMIVGHVIGNRSTTMVADSLTKLKNALTAALAAVPTGILCINSCGKNGLKAWHQGGAFHFDPGSGVRGPVSLQILDLQGRNIRTFSIPSGTAAVWNGAGSTGNAVPFGTYFVKVTGAGYSQSQRINWLP